MGRNQGSEEKKVTENKIFTTMIKAERKREGTLCKRIA